MQSKRILLVDDERSIREGLSKVLGAENYEVVLAENGQQAIDKCAEEAIGLLLLDLDLLDGDGWAILERLSETQPLLPVIVITGRTNQGALAEKAGADGLMEKPLDVPLLLRTVRALLDEPSERRAQRVRLRVPGFRQDQSDDQCFREMLISRANTPYPCSNPN